MQNEDFKINVSSLPCVVATNFDNEFFLALKRESNLGFQTDRIRCSLEKCKSGNLAYVSVLCMHVDETKSLLTDASAP